MKLRNTVFHIRFCCVVCTMVILIHIGLGVDFNSDPFTITINAEATESRANNYCNNL